MSTRTGSKLLVVFVTGIGSLLASAPALADLVFTSVPPTNAAVGQAYVYQMTAADDSDDDDDDEDREDRRERDRRPTFVARALPTWLEFDGRDTIFGTPRPEDVGSHRVKLRARVGRDHVDQEFEIEVAAAPSAPPLQGTDLAVSIAVAPTTVSAGADATWTVTARNLSDEDVANFVVETAFFADAPFAIDDVGDESCSIEPRGDHTAVTCRWSPLMKGTAKSAQIGGVPSAPGEVVAVARVSIVDAVPTDRNPSNDEARVVLEVTDDAPDGGGPDSDGSPVLTLNGASTIQVTVGETYQDPGATALDEVDGDLTGEILVDNPVDTNVIGRYSVTYDVVDKAGNLTTATRTVEVVPREPAGGGGGGAAGAALLLLAACGILVRRRTRTSAVD